MFQRFLCVAVVAGFTGMAWTAEQQPALPAPRVEKTRVLVVTGGHGFEREPFLALFEGYPDIIARHVEHPEADAWLTPAKADEYDVMVWYDSVGKSTPALRAGIKALLEQGKPLVALHHCIVNYRDWPEALKILGAWYHIGPENGQPGSSYQHDVDVDVRVADPRHPITRFTPSFTINDEVYKDMQFLAGPRPLLITDHPESDPLIGWTHRYGNSPVVYLQSGHGPKTYADANYRRLVAQAIRWAAGRLPDPDEEGFVPLFNGKDLDGWVVNGDPAGFEISKQGVLRSESGKGGNWVRTKRMYKDFILRVEWRVGPESNSGVFVRCLEEGHPWLTGSEVQISHQHRDDMHCTGSLYGRMAVDPRPDESPEQWHEFVIRCLGPRITVWADNVPVIDVDQRQVPAMMDLPGEGYIGLQDSHNPSGWVEFRRILVKELGK